MSYCKKCVELYTDTKAKQIISGNLIFTLRLSRNFIRKVYFQEFTF